MAELVWEQLATRGFGVRLWRARVPGGWLVRLQVCPATSVCFYADPEHHWDGASLPA